MKQVTIIIPAYNEEKFIADCLQSVYNQDYPKDKMEVIVVDGHSTDKTAEIVRREFPEVILLDNPDKIVPISMNMGIKQAKGDYIVRLDAHAEYPFDYLSRLINAIQLYKADNVGALFKTLPADEKNKSISIAKAMSCKFGMGNSAHRVGITECKEVDTVPYGCFPRNLFDRIGYFDEELIRNQDDEFNARIIKNGGKIYLLPDLEIEYYARDSIKKVSKMFFQYGLFKPLVNKKIGKPTSFRQFMPPAFVLGLLLGFFFCLLWPWFNYLYLFGISLYILLDIAASIKEAKSFQEFLYLLVIFPVIHFSYGWGYLRGILKILFKCSFAAEINR